MLWLIYYSAIKQLFKMEPTEFAFLEHVAAFWQQTEDTNVQHQAFSNLMGYTKAFLGRVQNKNVDLKLLNGVNETEVFMEIGTQTYSLERLVSFYDKIVVKSAVIDTSKAKHFGFIPGCGHFIYTVAEYLTSVSHVMPVARFANAGACDIEASVIQWVSRMVRYPETATGVMVSGTSMGAVVAFTTARNHLLPSSKQYSQAVVYMPSHTHQSNHRCLRVVGLVDCLYRSIPSVKHRMRPGSFEKMVSDDKKKGLIPFLVVASMGGIGVGAIDDFQEIFKVTQKYNIWFHVDASYGGFFLLDDTIQESCQGLEMSDSITVDFHKGLSAPYGTAVVLVRDGNRLRSSMKRDSEPYLPVGGEEYSPIDLSFEYTRPFRAFPVWFLLKTLGTDAIKLQVTEKIKLTEYAYKTLSRLDNVSVYMKPDLTIIAFRYNPADDEITKKWQKMINEKGEIFVSSIIEDDLFYIRLCILSLRTHLAEVQTALGEIQRSLSVLRESILKREGVKDLTELVQTTEVTTL